MDIRIGVTLSFDENEKHIADKVQRLIDEHRLGEKLKQMLIEEYDN